MTLLRNAFKSACSDNDHRRDGGRPFNSTKMPPLVSGWKVVRRSFMQGAHPAYYDTTTAAWYHSIKGDHTPLPSARIRNVIGWREE